MVSLAHIFPWQITFGDNSFCCVQMRSWYFGVIIYSVILWPFTTRMIGTAAKMHKTAQRFFFIVVYKTSHRRLPCRSSGTPYVKRIRFLSLVQVTQGFVTHLGHPVSKRTVQRRLHSQAIYSRVAVQKLDISLEKQLRRRRWCTTTLNWTVPDKWSSLLFSDESRSSLAYCEGKVRLSQRSNN